MKRKHNLDSQKKVTMYCNENNGTGGSYGSGYDLSFMAVDWSLSTFEFKKKYYGCG